MTLLPIHIAVKLQEMIAGNIAVPASALKHPAINKMLEDGVLQKKQIGKTKAVILIRDATGLPAYLHNTFGINSLNDYIQKYADENLGRSGAISISGNSKLKSIRTFKGFTVNSYQPIKTILHGKEFIISPPDGSFTFITDWETFAPNAPVTIIGLENAENFRHIRRLQYLFPGLTPLFVCRYPVSNDLLSWLKQIPNSYLHFGDLDLEGIHIYLSEYKKHLGERARFFVPPNIASVLSKYGNRQLYSRQYNNRKLEVPADEPAIAILIALLHKYKKALEQEIFINGAGFV